MSGGRLALALVAACLGLAMWRSHPPPARGLDAPATEFSAARALASLALVLGDGAPHPVGTEAHERVRERILDELCGMGLDATVEKSATAWWSSIALVRNVVAKIPGTEDAKAILLCAHYDSVPAGPGAGDDGSGVATLLEVARALKSGPPLRRPVILLVDDAEECGLLGARAYVERHEVREEIEAVVNCDARGTDGLTFLFETSAGNADLVNLYARAADRPCGTSAAYEVYKRMPNSTDLSVFKASQLPGLNFAFIGGLRRYHTPRDDLAHLSTASVQHEGDQVLAVARALASEEFQAKARVDLVYADVIGLFLLRWPESSSLPASIAILFGLVFATSWDVRRRTMTLADLGRGSLLALSTMGAAAASSPAIVHGIEFLRRHPEPWVGHPAPFEIAMGAGAAVAALGVARIGWLARAGFRGTWSGIWIVFAVAGVVTSRAVTGASYLFLVPCALAGLSRLSRSPFLETALPACALVLLWVPLALGLEQAAELRVPIALGVPLGAILAAAGPCWSGASRRRMRVALLAVAFVLIASTAWALSVPTSTADDPAWLPFAHLEESGKEGARLIAFTDGAPIPAEVRAAGSFSESPERAFPRIQWLPAGFAAPTAVAPASGARIEVLGTKRELDARIIDLRIASPRGSPCLVLHARGLLDRSGDHGVLAATLSGMSVRHPVGGFSIYFEGEGLTTSEFSLLFFGAPPEGVLLEFRVPLDLPAELLLLDVAYGLPPSDTEFVDARPARFVPNGQGDVWVVARRIEL